jgi:SulP family sulfate permease
MTLHLTAPAIPGALVLVVGGLVASKLFDLADRAVATVGEVPRGLPVPALPSRELISQHAGTIVTAAAALFLIGFSQTAGDARLFAARHRYRIRVDQEMVAQGMCNVSAGVFQGMPVSTSLSASSLNDSTGARTPLASIVTGVIVILTLLVLAPVFSDLPKPVLAALIIDAVVWGMIDVPEMRRLWKVMRIDFWIAALAIVGVLTAGVLAGVVIGIVLSIAWLVYVSATPAMTELGHHPGSKALRSLDELPDGEVFPGLLVVRFDTGLTFVTAEGLADELENRVRTSDREIDGIVIDFAGVNFIDSHGSDQLARVVELAGRNGHSLRLARVRGDVRRVLDGDGVTALLGEDRFHDNVRQAVRAEAEHRRTPQREILPMITTIEPNESP